ncbi:MAG: phage resistance protein, partial [Planctomycetia bacterium]|nr:phage resistance protein [Planctomycetia bacterium]
GSYLHGSFGAGKSHFMAVLHLILTGNLQARAIPELAGVIHQHNEWMAGRKFLLVPYHMIGKASLDAGILQGYVDFLERTQPGIPLPVVHKSAGLVEQARRDRASFGDEAFFKVLNAATASRTGWGQITAAWTPERFDAAAGAVAKDSPLRAEHTALVDRLGQHYRAAQHVLSEYVDLDDGLSVLSRHTKALGYDGLVLFLDELMLWLASHSSDQAFLERETSKLAKLVEPQNPDRPAPITSFIARQRDLRDLVGPAVTGAARLNYIDFVRWNSGRFGAIELTDRNLPVIAEKRVLRPKSPAARAEIDAAFHRTASVRASVMNTLLTTDGDRKMFRQVYPFSPALIQTLVAVSSVLQRERTALKVLMQLLVDHRDTLEVTDLVPVGDLFDILIHGDTVTDTDVITHFENAQKLLVSKLLPMLEAQHGKTRDEIGRLPEKDPTRRAFVTDERLVKTLLLAALVPEVEALKGMTAERLAALNHGTILSPIVGGEVQTVNNKVRGWAAQVGEIRISGDSRNPSIGIVLTDVDTDSILQRAASEDSYGNRVKIIRQIVFQQALGIEDATLFEQEHTLGWRGIERGAAIVFRNVRDMSPEQLGNAADDWKVVIDFPFDQQNFSPRDDLSKLDECRRLKGSTKTIGWVPAFFSQRTLDDLGRLAVLEHVLSGNRFDGYASHLTPAARQAAHGILENQRDTLRGQIVAAVNIAYGLGSGSGAGVIDQTHDIDIADRFQSLATGLTLRPPACASLAAALDDLLGQALAWEFPAAPELGTTLTNGKLNTVLKKVVEASQARDGRAAVERDDRTLLRQIADPLLLGEMPHDGTHFVIGHHWKDHFSRQQALDPGPLTVEKLRRWIDEPKRMGLTRPAQNLVILAWAAQSGMSFSLHGGTCDGSITSLDDTWVLSQETPPDQREWDTGLPRVGSLFGVAVSPLATAANAATAGTRVKAIASAAAAPVGRYTRLLETRLTALGIDGHAADRLKTAAATGTVLAQVAAAAPRDVVAVLSRATVPTSERAMSECITKAGPWSQALEDRVWDLVGQIEHAGAEARAGAEPILADVRDALAHDDHVATTPLKDVLDAAYPRLLAVLVRKPAPPPQPTPQPPVATAVPLPAIAPVPPAAIAPVPMSPSTGKVPARGSETIASADAVQARIDQIRAEWPGARIEVVIRWSEGP